MRQLSEYQQARQDLILDALREQQAYERSQRGKVVKAAKTTLKMLVVLLQAAAYIAISIATYVFIRSLH